MKLLQEWRMRRMLREIARLSRIIEATGKVNGLRWTRYKHGVVSHL
jgi:hypothetical protein